MQRSESETLQDMKPILDNNFRNSSVFPYFGVISIYRDDYSCNVSFFVSASEDIDTPQVIDFLKDFIPSQLDEGEHLKFLDRFHFVNNKISEVLAPSIDGDSFINLQLAYVLIKDEYFYVSLDSGFDLMISRGTKSHNLRKNDEETVSGSGLLKNQDYLMLSFNGDAILTWNAPEEIDEYAEDDSYNDDSSENDEDVLDTAQDENMLTTSVAEEEPMPVAERPIGRHREYRIEPPQKINKFEQDEDDNQDDYEINGDEDREEDTDIPRNNKLKSENGTSRISNITGRAKELGAKHLPRMKEYAAKAFKYIGEAFSFLLGLVLRRKGQKLSKALPNRKKGFLIISAIVFLVILLGIFIRSTNEDNARKQTEQKYREEVAQVGTNIKNLESASATIAVGDKTVQTKVNDLRTSVKNIESNALKDKLNTQNDINGYYKKLDVLQDRIDGVCSTCRIDESAVLTRFGGLLKDPVTNTSQNANPTSLTFRNGKLYFTDLGNTVIQEVDAKTGDLSATAISSKNDGLSKPQGLEFSKNKLLLLDAEKGVFEVDITAKKLKKLPGYDAVATSATSLKTYFDKTTDNFYLLQPSKLQIQRIPGLANGNFAVTTKYNKDDLEAGVEDFTIIGGSAYTINNTGVVNKYTRNSSAGATKDAYALPALDVPIGPGARITGMTPRETGEVYLFISDPKNNRILVFDNKDTANVKFVAQYKPTASPIDFTTVKAMYLDETAGAPILYVLNTYGILKIAVSVK